MPSLRDLIQSNMSILGPTYRTLSAIGAITMLGASVAAITNPETMSRNIGLPLTTSPSIEKNNDKNGLRSSSDASTSLTKPSAGPGPGYLMIFAGRNSVIGLSMLTLNYLGEMRALSIMGQLMTLGGLADSLATYWYGTPGSYKGHLYPTLSMAWLGPLGLLMYF